MKIKFLIFTFLLITANIYSQGASFKGKVQSKTLFSSILEKQFTNYQIYDIDANAINTLAKGKKDNFTFNLELEGNINFDITLFENDLRSDDYIATILTKNGRQTLPKIENTTFKGYHGGDNPVRLTINDNFIAGYIRNEDSKYYIEPLSRFAKNTNPNLFIVYEESSVIKNEDNKCMVLDIEEKTEIYRNSKQANSSCFKVKIANAYDSEIYKKYGYSSTNIRNFNNAVINGIEGFFDNEFVEGLDFEISELFISSCCDPWDKKNNIVDQLKSFRSWAWSGGFSNPLNIATLRTGRNLSGGSGISYRHGIKSRNGGYNLVEYRSSLSNAVSLSTHEFGHTFGSPHYNLGCFMNEGLGDDCWSAPARADINTDISYAVNNNLLSNCNPCELTPPSDYTYNNLSHNKVTIKWNSITNNYGYQIRYQKNGAPSWIIHNLLAGVGEVATLINLEESTTHIWQIRTRCTNGTYSSNWSSRFIFRTKEECRENITLTQTVNTGEVISEEVSNTITSYSTIQNNALAIYSAGNRIILKPGFHAKRVSTFAAFIEGCSNTHSPQFYEDNYENETSSITYRKERTQETSDLELIKLYPNPTTGIINIKSTKTINAWEIKNNLGVTLKRSNSSNMKQFNIQSLPNGIYFIQLITNTGEPVIKRIIKE